jgi:hypothetical protein
LALGVGESLTVQFAGAFAGGASAGSAVAVFLVGRELGGGDAEEDGRFPEREVVGVAGRDPAVADPEERAVEDGLFEDAGVDEWPGDGVVGGGGGV